jgi:beta-glucanase (GH16 family)
MGTGLGTFNFNGTNYWFPYIDKESEYLAASQVNVQQSNIIFTARPSAPIAGKDGTKNYISGYVTSHGKWSFQYGYIEIRAKMPSCTAGSQTGLWPALWLLNSTFSNQDEIDILESFGGDQSNFQMSVHNNALNSSSQNPHVFVNISPGYHTFGVMHLADSISLYVDNKFIQTFNYALPSHMAINLGLQLGNSSMGWISSPVPSNWGGGIQGSNTADLDLDWVHVWTP